MEDLTQYIPLTHTVISAGLKEYARPNDKISYLMEKQAIYAIAKGKYITNNAIKNNLYLMHQSANILYGPSYISRYSALSFYGLLSETTTRLESMTLKRSKTIENDFAKFDYYSQPLSTVFGVDIESKIVGDFGSILIANPVKALCDIIWTTPNLSLKSVSELRYFLEEDLRLDIDMLDNSNLQALEYCMHFGKKKREIALLLNLVKSL